MSPRSKPSTACTTRCSKAASSSISSTKIAWTPTRLSKYSALVLPNVALLSDAQCDQLRAYVKSGGSLFATFETSMFNERNEPRRKFRPRRRLRHTKIRRRHRHHRQRLLLAHRTKARNPRWLRRHQLVHGRRASPSDRANNKSRSDRRPRLRRLPARAGLSPARSIPHKRARNRPQRTRQKPPRLFLRRHRAHILDIRPARPKPPHQQHDSLDAARHAARQRRGNQA